MLLLAAQRQKETKGQKRKSGRSAVTPAKPRRVAKAAGTRDRATASTSKSPARKVQITIERAPALDGEVRPEGPGQARPPRISFHRAHQTCDPQWETTAQLRRRSRPRLPSSSGSAAMRTASRSCARSPGRDRIRAPVLRLVETGLSEPFPIGARAAAQLVQRQTGEIEARIIRVLGPANSRIVGVFHRGADGGNVVPVDRRNRAEYRVMERDAGGAGDGELVTVEESSAAGVRFPRARIIERLGHSSDAGVISLLAIASHDIPTEFPIAAIAEAEAARSGAFGRPSRFARYPAGHHRRQRCPRLRRRGVGRAGCRPGNRGGWHLVVAIADVAWYVRPGTALDREARRRGNSVYFPDRVVPMLPEALSNDLCFAQARRRPSLPGRPSVDRRHAAASGDTGSSAG